MTLWLSIINFCTWNFTAKNQQPNLLTNCSSNIESKFYHQTSEEGMANFWDGAMPIWGLWQGLLNGQTYSYVEHGFCEAHGSVTGR